MQEISDETREALLYVKKHQPVPIREFPFDISRFDYLVENEFIEKTVIRGKRYPDGYIENLGVKITARGRDALFLKRTVAKQARASLILSIIALALTFLVGFTPFADLLKDWISSLL